MELKEGDSISPPAALGGEGGFVLRKDDIAKAETITALIQADFSKSWSIASLAKKAGVPERRLQRIFKAIYGKTVMEYARELRLRQAHTLLETSDAPLRFVCEQVGFSDASNFSAAFLKLFGFRPGRVRPP